ncbi:hypothetical protein KPSA1_06453 [Pseudomonas syringae pv. actinidiae]|uniref:Uncharacterized protein n=1 Tax=Pseudomonas syringae pv. actinidiae TaxID=103796 RepID=A0A2V0QIN6_PSESF|nr:hypothetical protein KPSA1_06453 [Pseudomonas syringae pv. actinidiae]
MSTESSDKPLTCDGHCPVCVEPAFSPAAAATPRRSGSAMHEGLRRTLSELLSRRLVGLVVSVRAGCTYQVWNTVMRLFGSYWTITMCSLSSTKSIIAFVTTYS